MNQEARDIWNMVKYRLPSDCLAILARRYPVIEKEALQIRVEKLKQEIQDKKLLEELQSIINS